MLKSSSDEDLSTCESLPPAVEGPAIKSLVARKPVILCKSQENVSNARTCRTAFRATAFGRTELERMKSQWKRIASAEPP
jgi:hypothetical protein